MTLEELDAMAAEDFVAAIGDVFEHAPWIAAATAERRPFATVTALHADMCAVLAAAPPEVQLTFLRGHPDLGGTTVRKRTMAAFSAEEQGELGLDRLDEARFAIFERLNTAYRERFGIPFLVCVRRHTRSSILTQFARRLENDPATELAAALDEIRLITRLRIAALVQGPGMPTTSGWLSTHVLDTASGKPVQGIVVELFEHDGDDARPLRTAITNADGRTDAPLLSDGPLRIGHYELRFHLGNHFGPAGGDPAFLAVIPIRFAIADAESHYHIPLLVSPFAYATYRGS
jgi:2-oxo-4-hydroxy-4-carboxy-5-ureidoimidazoline decarboxylase